MHIGFQNLFLGGYNRKINLSECVIASSVVESESQGVGVFGVVGFLRTLEVGFFHLTPTPEVHLNHLLHRTPKLGILTRAVKMVQLILKLLMKQRILAVHHDLSNFVHSTVCQKVGVGKFWTLGVGVGETNILPPTPQPCQGKEKIHSQSFWWKAFEAKLKFWQRQLHENAFVLFRCLRSALEDGENDSGVKYADDIVKLQSEFDRRFQVFVIWKVA